MHYNSTSGETGVHEWLVYLISGEYQATRLDQKIPKRDDVLCLNLIVIMLDYIHTLIHEKHIIFEIIIKNMYVIYNGYKTCLKLS